MEAGYRFSIVIPVFNEEFNIPVLAQEIESVFNQTISYEVIWVDDASTDQSWNQLMLLDPKYHKIFRLARNYGQSTAIMAGIDRAQFPTIVTMDSDLQNDPKDIPKLLISRKSPHDVVLGYREKRNDDYVRSKISKLANFLSRRILKNEIYDLGCTLKVFPKNLMRTNRLFGEMHRVLPLYLQQTGSTVIQVSTNHRPRYSGDSKYGYNRIFKFLGDIILLRSYLPIMRNPTYFFGKFAASIFTISLGLLFLAIFLRLTQIKDYLDLSLIIGSLVLFSTSLIVLSLGLVSEILLRILVLNDSEFHYKMSEVLIREQQ
jgi:glycosyltransferase involved in cell wall biosynthesis